MRVPAWKMAASLLLAVVLFAYFLWRAPLHEVWEALATVKLGAVAAAVLVALVSYVLRALRWGVILRPVGRARSTTLVGCTAAGFATSTVLPARAGEVVRPLLLSLRTAMPVPATLASILTERLADLATLLVLFPAGVALASSRLSPGPLGRLHETALLLAIGLVVALVFVWLLLHWRDATIARLVSLLPDTWNARAEAFLNHLLDGLEVVRSPARLALLAVWSLAVWLTAGLQVQVLAWGFGISMTPAMAQVLIGVSVIGLAVPTPGGVGGFHAAVQFALTALMGVDLPTATAFALVHHAVCFFPISIVGFSYMGAVGLSPARARELEASSIQQPEGA
jgi:uncharacterized protein (TIRG00374 family)